MEKTKEEILQIVKRLNYKYKALSNLKTNDSVQKRVFLEAINAVTMIQNTIRNEESYEQAIGFAWVIIFLEGILFEESEALSEISLVSHFLEENK